MMRNQKGLVSLLAVSLVSLLVMIVAVAMSAMMVGELQQGIDNENSVKAYYLAQSGAEEAYATIKQELATPTSVANQDCSNNVAPGDVVHGSVPNAVSGSNARITCRVIESDGVQVTGTVQQDKAAVIDFANASPVADPSSITFSWDNTNPPPLNHHFNNMSSSGLDTSADPPPVELTIIDFDKGNAASSDIRQVVLVPCSTSAALLNFGSAGLTCGSPGVIPFDQKAYTPTDAPPPTSYNPGSAAIPVLCTTSNQPGPRCTANLASLYQTGAPRANPSIVVLAKPLYADMNFQLSAKDSFGGDMSIPLINAQVDVTARSGNSFQRIEESVPIKSQSYSGLDYVLFGNYSICKDLTLQVTPNGPPSVVPPGSGPTCDIDSLLTAPNIP